MKQKVLLLIMMTSGIICTPSIAQTKISKTQNSQKEVKTDSRELKVEDDGFEWYKVKRNGKWGAEDKKGKVLVPIENGYIEYQSGASGFRVTNNGDNGYYSIEGECIIPCSRHYYIINKNESSVGIYYWGWTKKDGPLFFCDAKGEEICQIEGYSLARPQYICGKFFWEVCLVTDDDNKWCILDGNGNLRYGPSEFVGCWKDGSITGKRNGKFVDLGNVSTITTTNNPFAKTSNIGIRYSSTTNSQSSSNSSSSANSGKNSGNSNGGSTTVVVEHHRDPVPMQEWQQCTSCWGSTNCRNCAGSGTNYIGSSLKRCSMCGGSGKCTTCSGQGGRYITVYR